MLPMPMNDPRCGSRDAFPVPGSVQLEMILLERRVAERPYRFHAPILGGNDPTLRDLLLRAGAAWLIGWAALLSALRWAQV